MSFKKDEESGLNAYYNNKSTIIQEARIFNESNVSPRKCRALLTRVVYLLYLGETLNTQEATNLFFGATKLFQNKDSALRQMVYLTVKELATMAEDVIMVTASIMKDMQPNSEVVYRPNAIRALCRIIDPSMVQGVERFFKSAIVDKNPSISSGALVSAYHLYPQGKEVIKRWVNEVQESVNVKPIASYFNSPQPTSGYLGFSSPQPQGPQTIPSTSNITQYHALGLLFQIRQQDRMAITKMIQQLGGGKSGSGSSLKNPMALCMLVRYAVKVMEEDPNMHKQMYDLLEGWLRHKSDMVNYEAARAICEMRGVTAQQLTRSVSVLQIFLSSPKPALKFAAIRTLSQLALTHPASVATCNVDMENLITDSNRSIATYAITTLLKTGNEASVDRLMKTITGFMSEISDEFKVIVVEAIRSLTLKFPAKQALMLNFLSGVLRDEGGYDFKRAVVEAIFDMIKYISDSKETALAHLCEFIEDCEFTKLSVRILHLIGIEGPKTLQPTKYIRYIYNRVVLENAIVRAAAVSSLAKFGVNAVDGTIRNSIRVLLSRCLDDVDDEVRDRAAMYLKVMQEETLAQKYVKDDSVFSLAALESQLVSYVNDSAAAETPFDVSGVPKVSRAQAQQESARPNAIDTIHIFKEHVVFQFNVSNTLPDAILERVAVAMQPNDAGLTEDFILPIESLSHENSPQIVYVSFTRDSPEDYVLGSFGCTLKYISKEVDPTSGVPEEEGYEDEYQLEEVELGAGSDYIIPNYAAFTAEWDKMKETGTSLTETFALSSMGSLKAACDSLIEILNMEALGGTENPQSTSVHTLNLSGLVTGGGGKVLARCRMTFSSGQGVTLELSARAEQESAARLVLAAIGG
ncbi:coatomer subunit gamma [Tulasnella sp. 408]|nr:coatomer subunit gamma [Tulasnella sp. 408]